jgi:hypothetical protein
MERLGYKMNVECGGKINRRKTPTFLEDSLQDNQNLH